MGKFNRANTTGSGATSVLSSSRARGETHEGGVGYGRDLKSELFLLAVSNLVGENTFYETSDKRDTRFTDLVHAVAVTDVTWLTGFVHWLRYDANMRTAALVAAAEGTKALLDADMPGGRQLIAGSMRRADEPGEFLAYWRTNIGRALPKPVKRGVSEAVWQLYNEHAALKYDTDSKGYRFADVIELVRPTGSLSDKGSMPIKGTWRADLYEWLIDRRHNREVADTAPDSLPVLRGNLAARSAVRVNPEALLDPETIKACGLTWENVLSLLGDKMDKAKLWEALIPSMGYMALLRNLRNFDQAGVPDQVTQAVAARLADPEQVAKSRQFPMRFLSAYRAAPSLRWSYPLEQAISASMANIPSLPGRTLIMVDTSSSMNSTFSKDGTLMRWDAAALFAIALGQRCENAEVVSFSSMSYYYGDPKGAKTSVFPVVQGESLLKAVERWKSGGYFLGGGTETVAAVQRHYCGQTRVVIVTDEQAGGDGDVSAAVPATVPLYTFNLAGYRMGHAPSGTPNRHVFGGLTDAAFKMIPWLEQTGNGRWPWEDKAAAE